MNENKFQSIPEKACMLAGGEVTVKHDPSSKTAPVKIKARSGKPLEHWFWGRVVHDLAGMRMHKPRLTLDYAHNDSEVIGYLNHFDSTSGDLMASGAIIPFTAGDRAEEVLFKMGQGVPYEASIFFGGDGIKVEEVPEGGSTQVNGYQFDGPGCVIREWPLRGVAVCPYGADQNTEATVMSGGKTYSAEKFTAKGDKDMKEEIAVEAKAGEEAKAVEVVAVEAEAAKAGAVVEPVKSVETAPVTGELAAKIDEVAAKSAADKAEIVKLSTELVASQKAQAEGAKSIADLTTERDALAAKVKTVEAECEDAKKKLSAIMNAGVVPVSATVGEVKNAENMSPWKKAQRR